MTLAKQSGRIWDKRFGALDAKKPGRLVIGGSNSLSRRAPPNAASKPGGLALHELFGAAQDAISNHSGHGLAD
jgi:hypothetical protein